MIRVRGQNAQSRIHSLGQTIQAKAFHGELVPQDPDDEPASVLRGCIQGEREETAAWAKEVKRAIPSPS